jgi:hypothetical protein
MQEDVGPFHDDMRVAASEVSTDVCCRRLTQFLTRLEALFASAQDKHSVYVTSKRCADIPADAGTSAVLFRATDGKSTGRSKFSTLVAPSEILAFETDYLALVRAQLASVLKKRDKAKERRVDKMLIASRKKIEENDGKVIIGGSKRGAGRRKRMRAVRRAQKLRASRSVAAT